MPSRTCLVTLLAGLALASLAFSQTPETSEPTVPTVVFVCEHGAAKSIIAAAHFNKRAKELGFPHRALSRGTHPDAVFSPNALSGLKGEGFELPEGQPVLVKKEDIAAASQTVTLGCKLPDNRAATDWDDVPSVSENYPAASRAIRRHVNDLMRELAAKKARAE